jgi:O-antigen/teichoic acid export membrane protein
VGNKSTVKYITGSFAWGTVAKLLDAGIKFLTIPFLLSYFGKENYGLLTLAIATNAYMALFDMGINIGAVKFFSQWIVSGKYDLLHRVAQTNITFYLVISLLNSIVLVILGTWGEGIFQVTSEEFVTFRYLLYILAIFSIVHWVTFVFTQLLIADEKIDFTQQINSIRSILGLILVGATIWFKWSLIQYFLIYVSIDIFVTISSLILCKKRNLIVSVLPAFYWKDFSIVFKYGLAILAMSLFQYTATQSRPLILGVFSTTGIGILSEYRIIEVFPLFIISLSGMLISIFLPKTARAIQGNNRAAIEKMAYEGTKYTSILVSVLCLPVMLNAQELLTLYVGSEYVHLALWLSVWVFTLILYLYNSPVASLVLATGRTKMLVYSSAIACIVSIVINILFCNTFGVGSAVVGYLVYIIIQMSFYYFYFNNKILGLNSFKVFKSFVVPTIIGLFTFLCVFIFKLKMDSLLLQIVLNTGIWFVVYISCLFLFRVISKKELFLLKSR